MQPVPGEESGEGNLGTDHLMDEPGLGRAWAKTLGCRGSVWPR